MSVVSGHLATERLATAGGLDHLEVSQAQRARGRRVVLLLGAIVLMSAGDLYMTLTHLTQGGMLEANPLARLVMAYNSPMLLALWKMASVGLAIAILFWARHRGRTEIATWFCFLVLTWLTCRWFVYNDQIGLLGQVPTSITGAPHSEWVAMTPED